MINLYDANEMDFTHNGLVVLSDCRAASVEEELNGKYELTLEYPLDSRGKWQYLTEGNIIKADGQLFRIYNKQKTLMGIAVNARHIFYDLMDNFLEDVRPTGLSGMSALTYILDRTQFPHSFSATGDVGGNGTRYFIRKNVVEAILGDEGIIDRWGGEIERDNFIIRYRQARGLDRGVLVSYGKNIIGIEETINMDAVCTRMMPLGFDGLLLPEKYIDSPYIENYPHPKVKVVTFNDAEIESDLRAAAQAYMDESGIDIPPVNYSIDFIELSKTEEYKNYAVLERVYMGDTVTIRHSKLGIDLKAKVIRIRKNILTNRIEEVELGSFKPNLATSINAPITQMKQQQEQDKSMLQSAIDNATAQINSALGGYVLKRNGELLIMDTEDVMTATKVWRWNQGGLGYSSTGYNGPYATAITADGSIVADFITTGMLQAITILGATITGSTITGSTVQAIDNLQIGVDGQISNPRVSFHFGGSLSPYDTEFRAGLFNYGTPEFEYDSLYIEVKSPLNDHINTNPRALMVVKGKGYGQYCDVVINGKMYVSCEGKVFEVDNGGNVLTNGGNINAGTGNVTANYFYGKIDGGNVIGQVQNALSSYQVYSSGSPAVVMQDGGNYLNISASGLTVVLGGGVRFQVNPGGTKTGGTIDIGDKTWGMSPVDSPRILISDLIINQGVTPGGTKVLLDEKLAKSLNGYAVFPSRGDVVISEKMPDSFIISGECGSVDLYIIGNRIGEESVYWTDMSLAKEGIENGEQVQNQLRHKAEERGERPI